MIFEIKDPLNNPLIGPSDWFNINGSWDTIFEGVKTCHVINETEASSGSDFNTAAFRLVGRMVHVIGDNTFDFVKGSAFTPFMMLTALRFKGVYKTAETFVLTEIMGKPLDYLRVGDNYFFRDKDVNRWGTPVVSLEPCKKEEMKQDFSYDKLIAHRVPKFRKFIIEPNNLNHQPFIGNKYNDYKPFPHKPSDEEVTIADFPNTLSMIRNIFGDKCREVITETGLAPETNPGAPTTTVPLSFIYMQVLYLLPKKILPILTLVSRKRETGKTTFLNWIQMLFADNTVMVNSQILTSNFTSSYATKNIVMIDEAVQEKSIALENLKSISTAKTIMVDTKHIIPYSVPFFGKVIMCSNKEKDFMRIDEEEIRFWVRKIEPIQGKKNTEIESDMFREIPAFLKYLIQLPPVDTSLSRQVLTEDEISTGALQDVKENSKSSLRQDIEMRLDTYFEESGKPYIDLSIDDLIKEWFPKNNRYDLNYFRRVVRDEMKVKSISKKYQSPFTEPELLVKPQKRIFRFVNPANTDIIQDEEDMIVTHKEEYNDPF